MRERNLTIRDFQRQLGRNPVALAVYHTVSVPVAMNLDPEFEPILKRWGSEEAVYRFLKKEFNQINRAAFDGNLETAELQIKSIEQNATGTYSAAERHRPAI